MTDTDPLREAPIAWIVLCTDADKIRIWWRDEEPAKAWAARHDRPLIPLYAKPFVAADFLAIPPAAPAPFQRRVQDWMMETFSMEICRDRQERNHRFIEEALELVQACGCTACEAHQLVDYVYGRNQGEINQEVGGVMVTLAALCLANDIDMHQGAEKELARVWTKIDQIRAKQASKPKHSPLPAAPALDIATIIEEAGKIIDPYAWTDPDDMSPTERFVRERQLPGRRDAAISKAKEILAIASAPQPAAPSDFERIFVDACDEIGCAHDNEALLQAIADLKKRRYALQQPAAPDDDWEERGAADELRKAVIEECARISDGFHCGNCGMDGKCGEAIRALSNKERT
jgi:NTP pyrophosphatase (non-canonical NTP hydrolase)